MDHKRLTAESINSKIALDKAYRPIGRISSIDEEEGRVLRIRISPHREFRQKHPEAEGKSIVLDAASISKLWGHNVVLDKEIKDLL